MQVTWDQFFMTMAYLAAMKSKDPSSKFGAVIVGPDHEVMSLGFNGFSRGMKDDQPALWERPVKYAYVEHAERNALYNSARMGLSPYGGSMYTLGTPCADCARGIIQSGLKEVIIHKQWEESPCMAVGKWKESALLSMKMFAETGVKYRVYDGPIISKLSGLSSGQVVDL